MPIWIKLAVAHPKLTVAHLKIVSHIDSRGTIAHSIGPMIEIIANTKKALDGLVLLRYPT